MVTYMAQQKMQSVNIGVQGDPLSYLCETSGIYSVICGSLYVLLY